MAYRLLLTDGSTFNLQSYALEIQRLDRSREYDLEFGRGVETVEAALGGDGLENPKPFDLLFRLRPRLTRAQQESVRQVVEAACYNAAALIDTATGTTTAIGAARVAQESNPGTLLLLTLRFWPGRYSPGGVTVPPPPAPSSGVPDTGRY